MIHTKGSILTDIETINAAAHAHGWQIQAQAYDEVNNPLGLADFRIVSLDDDATTSGHDIATAQVVEDAWSDDPLACSALDFLKLRAPEAYVTAIYFAHQTPYKTAAGQPAGPISNCAPNNGS